MRMDVPGWARTKRTCQGGVGHSKEDRPVWGGAGNNNKDERAKVGDNDKEDWWGQATMTRRTSQGG